MIYTYVLKSEVNGKMYTGSTNDLRKRLKLHNEGRNITTRRDKPYRVVYYEACLDDHDARMREKYLKSGMGKRYLKNRLRGFLSLTG